MKIKICGFTRRQDIEDAIALKVDFLGFNFYKKSPRYITISEAEKILAHLSPPPLRGRMQVRRVRSTVEHARRDGEAGDRSTQCKKKERGKENSYAFKIGVFVNPDFLSVEKTVKELDLSGIQLHGDETPSLCREFRKNFPDKILIKAIRIQEKQDVEKMERYEADFFLLDSYLENLLGGTGKLLNFEILNKISLPLHKIFIAGGITPDNVSKILQKITPYGIDTASGVEISPGIKDKEKMEKIVRMVKGKGLKAKGKTEK